MKIKKLKFCMALVISAVLFSNFTLLADEVNFPNRKIAKKIFTTDELVYFGIDYSNVKCVGSHGFLNPDAIKDRLFKAWNGVVISEKRKYNLEKTFRKTIIKYDLTIISERNKLPDVDEMVIDRSFEFKPGTVHRIISRYKSDIKEGIGLVIIMESLSKFDQKAYMHIIFFDIGTKQIGLDARMSAKAQGLGMRNYWINPVARVFKEIYKTSYKKWEKMVK